MKIKSWELKITWEDGTEHDVSCYVPQFTAGAIEDFVDYWEEKYTDEDPEEENE